MALDFFEQGVLSKHQQEMLISFSKGREILNVSYNLDDDIWFKLMSSDDCKFFKENVLDSPLSKKQFDYALNAFPGFKHALTHNESTFKQQLMVKKYVTENFGEDRVPGHFAFAFNTYDNLFSLQELKNYSKDYSFWNFIMKQPKHLISDNDLADLILLASEEVNYSHLVRLLFIRPELTKILIKKNSTDRFRMYLIANSPHLNPEQIEEVFKSFKIEENKKFFFMELCHNFFAPISSVLKIKEYFSNNLADFKHALSSLDTRIEYDLNLSVNKTYEVLNNSKLLNETDSNFVVEKVLKHSYSTKDFFINESFLSEETVDSFMKRSTMQYNLPDFLNKNFKANLKRSRRKEHFFSRKESSEEEFNKFYSNQSINFYVKENSRKDVGLNAIIFSTKFYEKVTHWNEKHWETFLALEETFEGTLQELVELVETI